VPSPVGRERVRVTVVLLEIRLLSGTCFCTNPWSKVRRERAPIAELESSANPQPGKAALRSARFPACGFWRLSSRQVVVLSRCAPGAPRRLLKIGARTAMSARAGAWTWDRNGTRLQRFGLVRPMTRPAYVFRVFPGVLLLPARDERGEGRGALLLN